jgi:hypothetical protein
MKKIPRTSKFIALCAAGLILAPVLMAKGKIEFGFHYGSWGINILKGVIEPALAKAMKDGMIDKNRDEHPDLVVNSSNASATIDSSGYNYGFEARWYPGGENGSFSLGLSVEQTSMKASITNASFDFDVSYSENGIRTTASGAGTGHADFSIKPLSFLLSFRWDIKPSWRVHPYVTFGLGIAAGTYLDQMSVTYDVHGVLNKPDGTTEIFPSDYTGPVTKTGADVRKEADDDAAKKGEVSNIPFWFVPFVQLNLGVKAKIIDPVYLLVDVGVWDGFLLRGGIAVRI